MDDDYIALVAEAGVNRRFRMADKKEKVGAGAEGDDHRRGRLCCFDVAARDAVGGRLLPKSERPSPKRLPIHRLGPFPVCSGGLWT